MPNDNLVFVFGTLKEGFPNFATNRGTRRAGEFVTVERYPLYLVGERMSPWMIAHPGEGMQVRGQVFSVSDTALAAMDALERIHEADGYRRLQISVTPATGDPRDAITVFAYLKPPEQLDAGMIRKGPLSAYELADAQLYRPRSLGQAMPPSGLDAVLAELSAREPIFHRHEFGTSREALLDMTAEDFWEIGASGNVYSRSFVIQTLLERYEAAEEDRFSCSQFQVRQVAVDLYQLNYLLQQPGRLTRRTTLWRRSGDKWKIVFHQGTVVS